MNKISGTVVDFTNNYYIVDCVDPSVLITMDIYQMGPAEVGDAVTIAFLDDCWRVVGVTTRCS